MFPLANLGMVLGVGPFHVHAHFNFIMVCAFWWALGHRCAHEIGVEKVGPAMKDLENATFLRVISVAIYAFIVQDVDYPPVELFLNNPDAFELRVNNAGAVVLLKFLRIAGIPTMQFQRAANAAHV